MRKILTLIALTFLIFTISANAYQNQNQCRKEIKKFWDAISQLNTAIDAKENKPGTNNFIYQLVGSAPLEDYWYGMQMGGFGRGGGAVSSLAKVRSKCRYAPENVVYAYEQTKIRVENYLESKTTREGQLAQYRKKVLNLLGNKVSFTKHSPKCQKSVVETSALYMYLNNNPTEFGSFTKKTCDLMNDIMFFSENVLQLCDLKREEKESFSNSLSKIRREMKVCDKKEGINEVSNTNNKTVTPEKIVTVKGIIFWASLDSAIKYIDGSGGVGFMTDSLVGDKIYSVCGVDDYCEVTGILNKTGFFISVSKVKKMQEDIIKIGEEEGDLGLYETFLLKSEYEKCRYTIHAVRGIVDTSCLTMTNSKGLKIVCTETKKICKTMKELIDFANKNIY